jgi:predicted PurR-regulated permease PerM
MTERIRLASRTKLFIAAVLLLFLLLLLGQLASILTPFILAMLMAYVLNPLVATLCRRTHLPRIVFVILLYAIFVGGVAWLISLAPMIGGEIRSLIRHLPGYLDELRTSLTGIGFTIDDRTYDGIKQAITNPQVPQDQGLTLARNGFEIALKFLAFLFATFFLLLEGEKIVANIRKGVPRRWQREVLPLIDRIDATVGGWVRGQLMLVLIMSVATFTALTILGINFALIIAIATGILETIPYVGPYAAGGLAVFVALVQPTTPFGWSNVTLALVVALIYTAFRQLEDYVVVPFVMGHAVKLHPMLVLFAAFAGAALAGVLGLFLAVPTVAIVKLLLEFIWPKLVEPDTPFEAEIVSEANALVSIVEQAASEPSSAEPPIESSNGKAEPARGNREPSYPARQS